MELGAGSGLVTHALALLGAEVWSTDQAPMLDILAENLDRNLAGKPRAAVRIAPLLWGDAGALRALRADIGRPPDLVVGSDIIYAKEGIEPLLQTVRQLCPAGVRFVLAYTRRFLWEETFFAALDDDFALEWETEDGDVGIVCCRRG